MVHGTPNRVHTLDKRASFGLSVQSRPGAADVKVPRTVAEEQGMKDKGEPERELMGAEMALAGLRQSVAVSPEGTATWRASGVLVREYEARVETLQQQVERRAQRNFRPRR